MAVRDIVHYGDPILRKKCSPVKDFSNLESLIDDLFDTMYEAEGVGLAANQIGLDQRILGFPSNPLWAGSLKRNSGVSPHRFWNWRMSSSRGGLGSERTGLTGQNGVP